MTRAASCRVDRPVSRVRLVRRLARDFKSAAGALIVFLVLAAYLYVASVIFLVGAQIDELLRKDASEHESGIVGVLAGASPTEAGA